MKVLRVAMGPSSISRPRSLSGIDFLPDLGRGGEEGVLTDVLASSPSVVGFIVSSRTPMSTCSRMGPSLEIGVLQMSSGYTR